MFQVLTGIEGYAFNAETYMSVMDKIDNQEMHVLPQREVFGILSSRGLLTLEAVRDLSVPGFGRVSTQFIAIKPIASSSGSSVKYDRRNPRRDRMCFGP